MRTTALSHAVDRVTTADVARLAGARAWPSISILLDTTWGDEMSEEDERRLAELVERAEGRPRDQGLRSTRLVATLRAQAEEATREPTNAGCAHLYRGYADTLHPVREHGFPVEQALDLAEGRRRDEDETRAFLDQVDSALGRARRVHPSPLVLAGATSAVSAFARSSRNLQRLAATLVGQDARDLAGVRMATRAAMDRYLLSRETEALATLNRAVASNPGAVISGPVRCWEALHGGRPTMLVVEEGFFFPIRVTANGVHPVEAAEVAGDADDLRHDVVDDLVETVIERGGWVAFTKDGALEQHGRIALLLGADPGSSG